MERHVKGHPRPARRLMLGRLIIALALLSCSTKPMFAAEMRNPELSGEAHEVLVLKGKQLRAEINAKYKELMSTKSFARENDVSSIVLKYVSPSMSMGAAARGRRLWVVMTR